MKKGLPLLISGLLLIIFGLLAVYSVSIYESFTLTLNPAKFAEPTNYYYFKQQITSLVYIAIALFLVWKFPMSILKSHKFATFALIAAFLLQLLVFTPLGETYGGARGWLSIPGVPNIQPSEVFKLAYVFFLASWLVRRRWEMDDNQFLIKFVILCAVLFAIFLFIPDLWTILIMGGTALVMVWFAGLSIKKTMAILVIGLSAGVFAGFSLALLNPKLSYIRDRFSYFFTTDSDKKDAEKENTGWQNNQALIAIWGGGFWGQWYGKGLQKFGYIPEAQSDFIFAAFSEEVGFLGNMVLLALYCWMFWYFLKKLQDIKDPQSKMIGVWIISILIVQTFVNIGVNIQIVPNTGVTLPFISAWGTSLLLSCIEVMILYKIIRSEEKKTVLPPSR